MRWQKQFLRTILSLTLFSGFIISLMLVFLIQSKVQIFQQIANRSTDDLEPATPFPVSVNPETESIVENQQINTYLNNNFASIDKQNTIWNQFASLFVSRDWYQNMGSPVSRIIVIWPGERKEEVAKNIGDILRWSKEDRDKFISLVDNYDPELPEGKYYPGQYVTHRQATPEEVANMINKEFSKQILNRYTTEVDQQVPLERAVIIASLLEREAGDFNNMREISGVIWNRLFIDMPLQLDASLQYVRGSRSYEPSWWPKIVPQDKFIDSPFNTYQNKDLPPRAISNVSSESILAALNPINTDCLYYFHTKNRDYHCSETYEEHVTKLRSIYGRGS